MSTSKIKKLTKKYRIHLWALIITFLLVIITSMSFPRRTDHANINSDEAFIQAIEPKAIQLHEEYHIPASIIMAQAILESDFGKSELSAKYNNLFGVKAGPSERSVNLATQEFVNGSYQTVTAAFKVYNSWDESLEAHTKLLIDGTTWNKDQYKAVKEAKNYREAAEGLVSSGYATDPDYSTKLINIIEKYKLYKYDN